jgi:hypothetical protein
LTRYGYVGHSGLYFYYRCNFDEIQGVIEIFTALSAEKKRYGGLQRTSLKSLESMSRARTIPAVDLENDCGSNGSGTSGKYPDSNQEAGEMRQ